MPYRSVYAFLWFVIKPYKWHYLAMLSAPILGAFYAFFMQYVFKMTVDIFSQPGEIVSGMMFGPMVFFVAAQVFMLVIWRGADIAEWRAEPYVRQTIFNTVYEHIQNNQYAFFQNTHAGSISSRIKSILDGYEHFWAAMHHDFMPYVARVVVLTATLSVIRWDVCLFMFAWVMMFYGVMRFFSKQLDHLAFVRANWRHHLFAWMADNIANMVTLFSFSSRQRELKKLQKDLSTGYIPAEIRLYHIDFIAKCVADLLYALMIIFIFFQMLYWRQHHLISTGDLVFVMGLSVQIGFDLWSATQKMQEFMQNMGDLKNACEILRTPLEEPEPDKLRPLVLQDASITFDRVSFTYDEQTTLFSQLSLSIQSGEKVGLVGLSGAGKSTCVSLILKYFPCDQGRILLGGQDIAACSVDSIREHIAVIPQDILLFHRTVFENIAYGKSSATEQEVIQAAKIANIHEFILTLPQQYETLVGERGVKLSGGQRQRIAIARAVLKAAPILILDEATANLDVQTERLIQSSLGAVMDASTTVLAIAHRLSTLKHMDRILVLENGECVEEGTHQVLLDAGGCYKRLWDLQQMEGNGVQEASPFEMSGER